jgi:hypothetical protein
MADIILIEYPRAEITKKDQFANEAAFTMHEEE